MTIRVLDAALAARIAAGEVVERPASVVKELLENAIDAGAASIEVIVRDSLTSSIVVADDGCGIPHDELAVAMARHATSKLAHGDVSRIDTLGFRGEALPSMAAVATVRLTSRHVSADLAFSVTADGRKTSEPRPVAHPRGTRVEVSDLFHGYPARLKFLKSNRTEMAAVRETLDAAALSRPDIEFSLSTPGHAQRYFRKGDRRDPGAVASRAGEVLGDAYAKDGVALSHDVEGISVRGLACLPTRTRRDTNGIIVAINGRPVSDKGILSSIRAAYTGLIAPGTNPLAYVAVEVAPSRVDVNVHPRKAEVRLADASAVAAAVTEAIRNALRSIGIRTSAGLADLASDLAAVPEVEAGDRRRLPLGRFIGQANGSWIVAETMDGIVIVDQHAAHERVILERLKAALGKGDGESITLPSPIVIPLRPAEASALEARSALLSDVGLRLVFGPSDVTVLATPAAIGAVDATDLVRDLAAAALEDPEADIVGERLLEKLATAGCRAAIKAGDAISPDRADVLLREMEATPNASTCNHGRPVVAFLSGKDLERLFARR